ncbi:hypothetical protein QX776_16380 [Alteromonadaceae bacterium BrNp21-10]|nr:hypothetical protein [Alteromonadaceae bacterium BrNp21-10]
MPMWQQFSRSMGFAKADDGYLEYINQPPAERGNRLCVSVSDIHLTDGTVGFQNLSNHVWESFYNSLLARCKNYHIDEVLFVLDGDIVDMIRSSRWAEHGVYPWQREKVQEFSAIVNQIIQDIVEVQHAEFFKLLRELPGCLKRDANVQQVKIVITVGNHDKELFCDQQALAYFYETALGIRLEDIDIEERRAIGRMYGNESQFTDPLSAPYLPFYYGDTGFRFFTTHGQWRDKENSRAIPEEGDVPGWSAADGWQIEHWQKLGFAPFFEPCFGDSVAAGVLSTFIYKVKQQLADHHDTDERLLSILDELDLYRPTYAALNRILQETAEMRDEGRGAHAVKIIESTLYDCIIQWLSWDFTYQTSPVWRQWGFIFAKWALQKMHRYGKGLEITAIAGLMKLLAFFSQHHKQTLRLRDMRQFPAFLPEYRHYGFQIHGEGHTHVPLEEQPNIGGKHPSTYINFGTWRDQIIPRKNSGYRRQGVLRAFYILDLVNNSARVKGPERAFDYFVEDMVNWGDFKDAMDSSNKAQPKI